MHSHSNGNGVEHATVRNLVLAAQQGHRDSFGELFKRYHQHVYAVALRRMKDHTDAQELVQDVFIQAMQKLDQLREPDAFGGWLRSITHRMAINRMVRNGPELPTEPDTMEGSVIDRRKNPAQAMLDHERRQMVAECMGNLRELDRATLDAFYTLGMSLREMSELFDAPEGTIKRRLHVARKRLGKEVEAVLEE